MIRVRQNGSVNPTQLALQFKWLLEHFDFKNDRITANAAEDITIDRAELIRDLAKFRGLQFDDAPHILRTYYFSDDALGILFRMKFI